MNANKVLLICVFFIISASLIENVSAMPFFWSKSEDSSELTQSTENVKSAEVIEATTTEETEKTEQSGEEKGELENEIYSIFQSVRFFNLFDFQVI